MRYYIRRIEPLQIARMLGVLYALLGLIFIPILAIILLASPETRQLGLGVALIMPLAYGFFGFVATLIVALLYNFIAGWLGGIAVELESRQ